MADYDHLKQLLEQQQQRWQTLHKKHQMMQDKYDRETRPEEKFRLQPELDQNQEEMTKVESEIQTIQTQITQIEAQKLRNELATLRRNKAYSKALDVARQIQNLLPGDEELAKEVAALQQQVEQAQDAKKVFAQLTAHFATLSPIIKDLAYVLTPSNEHEHILTITNMSQHFLDGNIQAADFISVVQSLINHEPASGSKTAAQQYARVAESIRKGRTVLFLGSAIPHLYSGREDDEDMLASRLAEEIQYQNFTGSLSSIAEYYQLAPGYGRSSLLDSLHKSLPHDSTTLSLYQSLARIPASLVLISAAYDTLLEQAFREANKPFVVIASIVIPSDEYKLGYVVLRYSDREGEELCPQEDLSRKDLLADYSIIYKIRGACDGRFANGNNAWRDSVTLSESNYFTFAENASKIIPDYLTRQFRDRGFLFIGFTPARWEDRLLARALLLKRRSHPEPCYTIGKTDDLLQAAFWENQNVRQYEMDFKELDRYLREGNA